MRFYLPKQLHLSIADSHVSLTQSHNTLVQSHDVDRYHQGDGYAEVKYLSVTSIPKDLLQRQFPHLTILFQRLEVGFFLF